MIRQYSILFLSILTAISITACGGSDEGEQAAPVVTNVGESAAVVSIDEAPYVDIIDGAGFKTIHFSRFPAQIPGKKANLVVYRAGRGDGGGMVYTEVYPETPARSVWHWYFADEAPDSARPVELNDDGLWDVQVYMSDGKTVDFVQDTDFTFIAPERDDFIAMNGDASNSENQWMCFDGDSTTAWTGEHIELPTPFGVAQGQLSIQLPEGAPAGKVEVKADGKTVQTIELKPTISKQVFALNDGVKSAKVVRLEAKDGNLTISELALP